MSEPEPEATFSAGQKRLLAFAASFFALAAAGALIGILIYGLGWLTVFFADVLWPLAVAGVLAMILRPAVEVLERRVKSRPTAVVILYGLFLLVVAGVAILVIPPLVEQTLDLVTYAPTLWEKAVAYLKLHYPAWITVFERLKTNALFAKALEGAQTQLAELPSMVLPSLRALGGGALVALGFVTHLAIIPIYLFFFLLARGEPTHRLPEHLGFLRPHTRASVLFLVREFVAIVISFFRGQILIGLIMGTLLATGFTIAGLKFGMLLGLFIGLLNIIPYLGTIIGLTICLPLAFFQPEGGLALMLIILGIYILVQNIEGWFLTPRIMGERTGLHPVAIIVAIFFWGKAFGGLLGMILAIPLTAFFVTAWRWVRHTYFSGPGQIKP